MYDINTLTSIVNIEPEEEIVKVYSARHSNTVDLKKLLTVSLLSVTAVMFAFCFYLMVFCTDIKKGSLAYDSVSYWTIISVIILAFAFVVLYCLAGSILYYGLKGAALKNSCKGIVFVLTSRKLVTVDTTENTVLNQILLSEVTDISRYTDDQLKILTVSGKDLIIKPDDTQDFIDTYPGLLRSERQRAKRNTNEG